MTDWKQKLSEEMDDLRRVRDELRVQLKLGRAEAKERWEALEKDWQHLEGRMKLIGEESKESAHEIGEAAKLLVGEIREGYRRLRDML